MRNKIFGEKKKPRVIHDGDVTKIKRQARQWCHRCHSFYQGQAKNHIGRCTPKDTGIYGVHACHLLLFLDDAHTQKEFEPLFEILTDWATNNPGVPPQIKEIFNEIFRCAQNITKHASTGALRSLKPDLFPLNFFEKIFVRYIYLACTIPDAATLSLHLATMGQSLVQQLNNDKNIDIVEYINSNMYTVGSNNGINITSFTQIPREYLKMCVAQDSFLTYSTISSENFVSTLAPVADVAFEVYKIDPNITRVAILKNEFAYIDSLYGINGTMSPVAAFGLISFVLSVALHATTYALDMAHVRPPNASFVDIIIQLTNP